MSPHSPQRARSNAFSLPEVLLSIGIIIVSLAILFPVSRAVRVRIWMTKGIQNAKQLTLAAQRYATEHRGLVPQTDYGSYPDPSGYTRWQLEIAPYVYSNLRIDATGWPYVDGVFRCPGLNGDKVYGNQWEVARWTSIDWINVQKIWFNGERVSPSLLLHPVSRIPYLVSTDRNTNGTAGLLEGSQALFETYVPEAVWIYSGGVIVSYLDGHVEIVRNPNALSIFKK